MNDEYRFLWAQWGILNLRQCRLLFSHFGSFEAAWKKITPAFLQQMGVKKDRSERVFQRRETLSFSYWSELMKGMDIHLVFIDDAEYPIFLKQIDTAPPFLFVRGSLPSFHKSISVVGTRGMSTYGRLTTERLTADLVQEGFVVVSGLALGVDSVAHKTTIKQGGITVAVLGSGVDQISPSINHRLAQDILDANGAIVSSYPLGTPAESFRFPERNEIVAGLSKGTLVIEGGVKSGALITAKLALDFGREVFAVPCNITNLALSGTNHLIRKSAAKLVENVEHILEDFGLNVSSVPQLQEFTREERMILEKLSLGPKNLDQLLSETSFDVPRLSELLIYLQLKKAVSQQGERWVLV